MSHEIMPKPATIVAWFIGIALIASILLVGSLAGIAVANGDDVMEFVGNFFNGTAFKKIEARLGCSNHVYEQLTCEDEKRQMETPITITQPLLNESKEEFLQRCNLPASKYEPCLLDTCEGTWGAWAPTPCKQGTEQTRFLIGKCKDDQIFVSPGGGPIKPQHRPCEPPYLLPPRKDVIAIQPFISGKLTGTSISEPVSAPPSKRPIANSPSAEANVLQTKLDQATSKLEDTRQKLKEVQDQKIRADKTITAVTTEIENMRAAQKISKQKQTQVTKNHNTQADIMKMQIETSKKVLQQATVDLSLNPENTDLVELARSAALGITQQRLNAVNLEESYNQELSELKFEAEKTKSNQEVEINRLEGVDKDLGVIKKTLIGIEKEKDAALNQVQDKIKEVGRLTNRLTMASSKATAFEQANKGLQNSITDAENRLAEAEELAQKKITEAGNLERKYNETLQAKKTAEQLIETIREESTNNINRLNAQINQNETKIREASKNLANELNLQRDMSVLELAREAVSEIAKQKVRLVQTTKNHKQDIQQRLFDAKQVHNRDMQKLQATLTTAQETNVAINDKVRDLDNQLLSRKNVITRKETEITRLNDTIQTTSGEAYDFEQEAKSLRLEIERVTASEKEALIVVQEAERSEGISKEEIADLKRKASFVAGTVRHLQQQAAQLQTQINFANEQAASATIDLQDANDALSELKDKLHYKTVEANAYNEALIESTGAIEDANTELTDMKLEKEREVSDLNAQLTKARKDALAAEKAAAARLQNEQTARQQEANLLKEQLTVFQNDARTAQLAHSNVKAEKDKLEESVKSLEGAVHDAMTKATEDENAKIQAKIDLAAANKAISDATKDLAALQTLQTRTKTSIGLHEASLALMRQTLNNEIKAKDDAITKLNEAQGQVTKSSQRVTELENDLGVLTDEKDEFEKRAKESANNVKVKEAALQRVKESMIPDKKRWKLLYQKIGSSVNRNLIDPRGVHYVNNAVVLRLDPKALQSASAEQEPVKLWGIGDNNPSLWFEKGMFVSYGEKQLLHKFEAQVGVEPTNVLNLAPFPKESIQRHNWFSVPMQTDTFGDPAMDIGSVGRYRPSLEYPGFTPTKEFWMGLSVRQVVHLTSTARKVNTKSGKSYKLSWHEQLLTEPGSAGTAKLRVYVDGNDDGVYVKLNEHMPVVNPKNRSWDLKSLVFTAKSSQVKIKFEAVLIALETGQYATIHLDNVSLFEQDRGIWGDSDIIYVNYGGQMRNHVYITNETGSIYPLKGDILKSDGITWTQAHDGLSINSNFVNEFHMYYHAESSVDALFPFQLVDVGPKLASKLLKDQDTWEKERVDRAEAARKKAEAEERVRIAKEEKAAADEERRVRREQETIAHDKAEKERLAREEAAIPHLQDKKKWRLTYQFVDGKETYNTKNDKQHKNNAIVLRIDSKALFDLTATRSTQYRSQLTKIFSVGDGEPGLVYDNRGTFFPYLAKTRSNATGAGTTIGSGDTFRQKFIWASPYMNDSDIIFVMYGGETHNHMYITNETGSSYPVQSESEVPLKMRGAIWKSPKDIHIDPIVKELNMYYHLDGDEYATFPFVMVDTGKISMTKLRTNQKLWEKEWLNAKRAKEEAVAASTRKKAAELKARLATSLEKKKKWKLVYQQIGEDTKLDEIGKDSQEQRSNAVVLRIDSKALRDATFRDGELIYLWSIGYLSASLTFHPRGEFWAHIDEHRVENITHKFSSGTSNGKTGNDFLRASIWGDSDIIYVHYGSRTRNCVYITNDVGTIYPLGEGEVLTSRGSLWSNKDERLTINTDFVKEFNMYYHVENDNEATFPFEFVDVGPRAAAALIQNQVSWEREREIAKARAIALEKKRIADKAEVARLAEEARIAEEVRIAEQVRIAEEARIAEEERRRELAKLNEAVALQLKNVCPKISYDLKYPQRRQVFVNGERKYTGSYAVHKMPSTIRHGNRTLWTAAQYGDEQHRGDAVVIVTKVPEINEGEKTIFHNNSNYDSGRGGDPRLYISASHVRIMQDSATDLRYIKNGQVEHGLSPGWSIGVLLAKDHDKNWVDVFILGGKGWQRQRLTRHPAGWNDLKGGGEYALVPCSQWYHTDDEVSDQHIDALKSLFG